MTGTVHVAGAVAASAIALPVLGFAAGPVFHRLPIMWQPVGPRDPGEALDGAGRYLYPPRASTARFPTP